MTTSHETECRWRRRVAGAVFAAMLAQMSLPAVHAAATERHQTPSIPSWQTPSLDTPAVTARSASPTHDPATCPICQVVMRANPVAMTAISRADSFPKPVSALPAASDRIHSTVGQSSHAPRAPPSHAFHLA